MKTKSGISTLLASYLVFAMILWFALPSDANALLRGVASGGSSSGGSTSTGCTATAVPGGIVVATAGTCVSTINLTTDNKGNVSAAATVNALAVSAGGQTLNYTDTNVVSVAVASGNTYVQNIVANLSNGSSASADFVTSINNSTASTNYGDFGQNGSGFSGSGAANTAGNVYLTSNNVDLFVGPNTANSLHFGTNAGPSGTTTDAATVTNNLFTFGSTVQIGSTNGFKFDAANSSGFATLQTQTAGVRFLNSSGASWIPITVLSVGIDPTGVYKFGASNPEGAYDTGISRCASGVICLGNGTNGDNTASVKGVSTNSSAPAGSIGEEIEVSVASTGAVVTVSSNTAVTVVSTGATVTAGDYDATGIVCFTSAAATSFTNYTVGLSTTTNVLQGLGTYNAQTMAAEVPGTITAGTTLNENCMLVPRRRILLSGTGTVFAVARPVFSVSGSITAYGQIMLRRVR